MAGHEEHDHHEHHDHGEHHHNSAVGFASPQEAMQAPREEFLYVAALHTNTGVDEPDFLAVVDVNPESDTYSQITHRLPMPNKGDELHHFGWQVCSSACHSETTLERKHMIVPGLYSSNLYIVDVGTEPKKPSIAKVIPGEELKQKVGLTGPHTVHCMPGGIITISMLGDAEGNGPGGFAVLDAETFDVLGRWDNGGPKPDYSYDFWYQPRHNVLVSTEWAAPKTFQPGFNLQDVVAGNYGRKIHFWDLEKKELEQSIDLGEEGLIPLETRFFHSPEAASGYVGAALGSTIWHFERTDGEWKAEKVIAVEPHSDIPGWDIPVPGLITDILISMDDRFLYFSDWLHGDLRQYDVTDPKHPKLTGQVWLGGLLGKGTDYRGQQLNGGPQMLQLSMDGRRLYTSNSLYSTWDNQFSPGLESWLVKIDVNPEGGMSVDQDFFVDFSPARAHEIHLPYGDCSTEIFP
jgi:selenium-binding protein 1